jgi:hypothetical protein
MNLHGKVFMKKTLVIIFTVVALFGCKGKERTGENTDRGVGPIIVPGQRNYTASEVDIGRGICAALKQKREFFENVPDMQLQFRLSGALKYCGNPNVKNVGKFSVSVSNSNSTDLEYVADNSRPNYFKDILHDQNGAMKIVCDNLSKSDAVSNTMLSGSSYIIVNLLISEGYYKFEISKRTKGANGNYNTASSESVSVITKLNQPDTQLVGIEKERIRYTPCQGSKDFSYLKQIWIEDITKNPI